MTLNENICIKIPIKGLGTQVLNKCNQKIKTKKKELSQKTDAYVRLESRYNILKDLRLQFFATICLI